MYIVVSVYNIHKRERITLHITTMCIHVFLCIDVCVCVCVCKLLCTPLSVIYTVQPQEAHHVPHKNTVGWRLHVYMYFGVGPVH